MLKMGEIAKDSRAGHGRASHSTGFTMEIEGLDALMASFNELGENAILKLSEPSVEAANKVLEKARSKIRDDTGTLKNTLKVTKPGRKRKSKYRIFAKVGFGKGGMYGVPLELGHRLVYMGHRTYKTVHERPFLRPAADESKDQVVSIMVDAMNRIIDESGGSR